MEGKTARNRYLWVREVEWCQRRRCRATRGRQRLVDIFIREWGCQTYCYFGCQCLGQNSYLIRGDLLVSWRNWLNVQHILCDTDTVSKGNLNRKKKWYCVVLDA